MKESIRLEWDAHTKSSPLESDRWASSDRGWLFASIHPKRGATEVSGSTYVCVGHYLDYEKGELPVHVVSCVTRASTHVTSPEKARAWLEKEAEGKIATFFADSHNGYEHRKVEIRAMRVYVTPKYRGEGKAA